MRGVTTYQAISSEGGLLPADLLKRISEGDKDLPGLAPTDYQLHRSERLTERISQSWLRLGRLWKEFQPIRERFGENLMLSHTYDEWVQHLLMEMGYGQLAARPGTEVDGVSYPIHRFEGAIPVHVVSAALNLDRRHRGVRGAARKNAHGMVQEFLNRKDEYLWAIVTNGTSLRILRDNEAISRPAYLEFDVEAMFEGELYAEFVVMWLVAHASRGQVEEGQDPATCLWERWTQSAEETGTRALEDLRSGVESALLALGQGLVEHPSNDALRDRLASGELSLHAFHNLLLRTIYRLLFLFVAEDRDLLKDREADPERYEVYLQHYGGRHWRVMADLIRGSRHHDVWEQFMLVTGALSGAKGFEDIREALGLTALGSSLWDPRETEAINGHALGGNAVVSNERFLDIVRHLAFTVKDGVSRSVDFRNLGSEELGSVYEGLLALTPKIEGGGHRFLFEELSGNQRKTSGSYYTPDSLVRQLLETALEPVVQERLQDKELAEQEQAILGMAVCDPAAGSGHFLVGAAHYLAERLGGIRARLAGEDDPTPELYQQALRDVIAHCIYGVDMNPMAVELCKVTLWMESMEPGRPLGFLEHHIRLGNSLVGAPKDAYAIGIPDGAFKGLEGDDKTALKELKKLNRQRSRKSVSTGLFEGQPESVTDLRAPFSALEQMPDDSLASIADKHRAYEQLRSSDAFQEEKRILDAWTAAFFVPKSVELNPLRYHGITNDHLDVLAGKKSPSSNLAVDEAAIERWTSELRFFHWHLEFPLVMERGGFDVMLGNPPWERVKIQRVEWFAQRLPSINAVSTSAKRKAAIAELEVSSPEIFAAFKQDEALALAISGFLRHSGLYPLGGVGDVNYANVFAELFLRRLCSSGLFGAVLPSGVCTGDTMKHYFNLLVEREYLHSFFDFENKGLFEIHSALKFGLLTAGGLTRSRDAQFSFFLHSTDDLKDPERLIELSKEDIQLLNPNTKNCPVIRSRMEGEILKRIYRHWPVLIREKEDGTEENPWGVKYSRMFDISNDSGLFKERPDLEQGGYRLEGNRFVKNGELDWLPLYEGKMIGLWNHRAADVVFSEGATSRKRQPRAIPVGELEDPSRLAIPFSWVREDEVRKAHGTDFEDSIVFGVRVVSSPTNNRSFVGTLLPLNAIGHSLNVWKFGKNEGTIDRIWRFQCIVSSYCWDFIVRCKMGDVNLPKFLQQQIALPTEDDLLNSLVLSNAEQEDLFECWKTLSSTCTDLVPFLEKVVSTPVLQWSLNRDEAEVKLNALIFRVYLSSNPHFDDMDRLEVVEFIMDSFAVLKKREEKSFGEFRTKRAILDEFALLSANS